MTTDYRRYEGKFVLVTPTATRSETAPIKALVHEGKPYTYAVQGVQTHRPYIDLSPLSTIPKEITPIDPASLNPLERSVLNALYLGEDSITLQLFIEKK